MAGEHPNFVIPPGTSYQKFIRDDYECYRDNIGKPGYIIRERCMAARGYGVSSSPYFIDRTEEWKQKNFKK
jgi:hypothetical protein